LDCTLSIIEFQENKILEEVSIYDPINMFNQKSLIMKPISVFAVFIFICLNVFSQSKDTPRHILGVEKEQLDSKKEFVFKPNCFLKIKTENGKKYFSRNYSFTQESIVMNNKDTILFDNILWIQGEVYKDGSRKAFGAIVTLISIPIIFIGIGESITLGGVVGYFVSVPFIGLGYSGIRLIGARRFRLSQDCYIKAIEQ
jgi:hypothetical protein